MAQGEFWVERQNWARWPKVIKVNRTTYATREVLESFLRMAEGLMA